MLTNAFQPAHPIATLLIKKTAAIEGLEFLPLVGPSVDNEVVERRLQSFMALPMSTLNKLACVIFSCGYATLQEAPSVRPLVRNPRVEKWENAHFRP